MHICFSSSSIKSPTLIDSIKRRFFFTAFTSFCVVGPFSAGASLTENTRPFNYENGVVGQSPSFASMSSGEIAISCVNEANIASGESSGTNGDELLNENEEGDFQPSPYKAAIQEMFEWLLTLPKERLEKASEELDQNIVDTILRMIENVPLTELRCPAYLHAIGGAFFLKYGGHCDGNGEECEHGPYEFELREETFTAGVTSGAIEDVIFPDAILWDLGEI
jgi:hypothetical protein